MKNEEDFDELDFLQDAYYNIPGLSLAEFLFGKDIMYDWIEKWTCYAPLIYAMDWNNKIDNH